MRRAADPPGYASHRRFVVVLVLSFLVRAGFAVSVPLGVDEAYAIAVAREFSWAFFDHPPVGFWSPMISAALGGVENPLVFRLPTLIYGALTTVMIYGIARQLAGPRAGLLAAILITVSPAFVFSGVFILPDGPLNFGAAFSVYWSVRIAKSDDRAPILYWVLAGGGLALALASKYQAALVPVSVLGFMLLSPVGRRWFVQPGPYIAAMIGLIGIAPVVFWNLEHDWVSFRFHTGRVGAAISPLNMLLMSLGQLFYLLPPILIFAAIGLWRGLRARAPETQLVAMVALGPIVVFNLIFLFSANSFPHWTMPGWLVALPLAAIWLSALETPIWRRFRAFLSWFAGLGLVVLLVLLLHLRFGVLTYGYSDPLPDWDDTINSFDYSELESEIQRLPEWENSDLIATTHWIDAGLISTALKNARPMKVLGRDTHHFAFTRAQNATGSGLLLQIAGLASGERNLKRLLKRARKIDAAARALSPIVLSRGSRPYLVVNVVALDFP